MQSNIVFKEVGSASCQTVSRMSLLYKMIFFGSWGGGRGHGGGERGDNHAQTTASAAAILSDVKHKAILTV